MDGNHKWPFAVATASNAWAARRNSIVEVWSVDSPDPQETGSLVASFSQDAAVMSLAVTQSLILPDGRHLPTNPSYCLFPQPT